MQEAERRCRKLRDGAGSSETVQEAERVQEAQRRCRKLRDGAGSSETVQEAQRRCRKLRDGEQGERHDRVDDLAELQVIFRKEPTDRVGVRWERERVKDKCKVFCLNSRKKGVAFSQERGGFWVESG